MLGNGQENGDNFGRMPHFFLPSMCLYIIMHWNKPKLVYFRMCILRKRNFLIFHAQNEPEFIIFHYILTNFVQKEYMVIGTSANLCQQVINFEIVNYRSSTILQQIILLLTSFFLDFLNTLFDF